MLSWAASSFSGHLFEGPRPVLWALRCCDGPREPGDRICSWAKNPLGKTVVISFHPLYSDSACLAHMKEPGQGTWAVFSDFQRCTAWGPPKGRGGHTKEEPQGCTGPVSGEKVYHELPVTELGQQKLA